ncbi:MAG: endo alpha-1,4 polygalactosaminidase [bacterium]
MRRFLVLLPTCLYFVFFPGCSEDEDPPDFAQYMREFVLDISAYARGLDPTFLIIPQNGQELLTVNLEANGNPATAYIAGIDGVGREDLLYGYDADDVATSQEDTDYLLGFLNVAVSQGLAVLVTDYCSTPAKIDDAYARNSASGFIPFAANSRELDRIPAYPAGPYGQNADDVTMLSAARNFLYILAPDNVYGDKAAFIAAMAATNHDALIIDLFFGDETLDVNDVGTLKTKANGGERLVIAYLSIGEAEDYQYYWRTSWQSLAPPWLDRENPDWAGNYKVRYWLAGWQEIIFGNDASYLKKIIDAGFDGAYLDVIDAFEYYQVK